MNEEPPAVVGPVRVLQVMPRLIGGLTLCSGGIAMTLRADLGLGPWDVLHQGLSLSSGISIGTATILVGFAVLLLWLPLRQRPGLGTITNVVWIGVALDMLLSVTTTPGSMALRWLLLLSGPVLFGVGVAMYIGAGVGTGPRDGVMTGLELRGVPIAAARTAIELTALGVGWALGGTVGFGTIYFALTIGPVMHLAMPRFRAPWFPVGAQPRVFGGARGGARG
jgi:uncharacterized membrane protein YczE